MTPDNELPQTPQGNYSVSGATNVGTASASHPDPSTLTPAERAHLGIE